MARKSNYNDISSREQLEQALRQLDSDINAMEVKTRSDYGHIKSFYTPANIYSQILDGFTPVINLAAMAVDFYERVKKRVAESRQDHSQSTSLPTGEN